MHRKRSADEIRRLKELGAFDPGTHYSPIGGLSKKPKQVYWDEDEKGVE